MMTAKEAFTYCHDLTAFDDLLTPWEVTFISDVYLRCTRGLDPTISQADKLREVYAKHFPHGPGGLTVDEKALWD